MTSVSTPATIQTSTHQEIQKKNFRRVEIDAVGIGLANAASPFLPVFLTRIGATSFQVGLLTSMPAVAGLLLSIPVGRFLQTRRKIVPWFSLARLLVVSSFALTGLVPFFVPDELIVPAVLAIWALATLPQTMVAVAFSVVMNAVAGPEGRYALMSARWSILGLTTAATTAIAGQILTRIGLPINYQVVFIGLSLGGLISYYFSSRIELPEAKPPPLVGGHSLGRNIRNYSGLLRSNPAFVSFVLKRLVYLSGISLATPLFPLYFVRVVHASDASIGLINTAATAVMVVGYFIWTRLSKKRGNRIVLLITTFAIALYPALVAQTQRIELIIIYAGLAGFFSSGLDLVFFDELMNRVPVEYSATFVSIAQSVQYLSAILAPLIGTYLSEHIGISGALLASSGLRLIGFALFAIPDRLASRKIERPATDKV